MRVLHLIDSGGLYGAEQVLLTLCAEQKRQRLDPFILSCGLPEEPEKPVERAANELGIPVKAWRMEPGLNLAGINDILSWSRDESIDLFHSHGYKFNILLALVSRSVLTQPVITTLHGYVKAPFPTKMWFYERLDRLALERLNAVVLVSHQMRRSLSLVGRLAKSARVIHNGIADLPEGHELHPRQDGSLAKRLLAVGRLSPEKGFDLLLQALAELHQQDAGYSLTLMGEGPLQEDLDQQVKTLGLQGIVTFAGYKKAAWQYYNQYDALVLPSRTEGIPITLLEAVRSGMPVFATRVGGMPEVLGAQSLLLIEPGSAFDIAKKLNDWNSRERKYRVEKLKKLREVFKTHFKSEAMAGSYAVVYQSIFDTRCNEIS